MKAAWWRPAMVAWCGIAVPLAVTGGAARGQAVENLALASTYGGGVHAFFCGDYDRSYEDLTAAIAAGSEDPRTRYFRGLAALRLGRLDEAEADFAEGAELESRAIGGWPVSRSLERVQGHDRLQLERHRVRARVAAMQRAEAAERERFMSTEAAQPEVLRRRRPLTLPVPAADAANPFVEPAGPDGQRPQPPEPSVPSPPEVPAPSTPETPAESVPPAAEPPSPPSPPEPADPFDTESPPPAKPTSPAEAPDPFDP